MLGPFATASRRRTPIHQVSLLSHAACTSMSTTTTTMTTTTTRDRGPLWPHRMGPIISCQCIKFSVVSQIPARRTHVDPVYTTTEKYWPCARWHSDETVSIALPLIISVQYYNYIKQLQWTLFTYVQPQHRQQRDSEQKPHSIHTRQMTFKVNQGHW